MDQETIQHLEKRIEKKYKAKEGRKRKQMKISGKSVFKLKEIMQK